MAKFASVDRCPQNITISHTYLQAGSVIHGNQRGPKTCGHLTFRRTFDDARYLLQGFVYMFPTRELQLQVVHPRTSE